MQKLPALNDDQQQIAARVQAVLTKKNPDGGYRYTKEECRAFIVATVLDLGLTLPKDLESVFLRFLTQIKVPADASDEVVVQSIRQYFVDHPLNPELVAEMKAMASGEKGRPKDAVDEAAVRERVGRARSVGKDGAVSAPRQADAQKTTPTVKPRTGLR
jgi:hypothetical protein